MQQIYLLIIALISGVFAGMGMGGGTFLIPTMSLIFGFNQVICQSTNVVCFIFLGFVCVLIYYKEKLIDFLLVIFVSIPACFISVLFSIFSIKVNSTILKMSFSIFIICFGIFYFVNAIINFHKKSKNSKYKNK